MLPNDLRKIAASAAKRCTYPEIKAELETRLEPQFVGLGMKLAMIHAAECVCNLSSIHERRNALDSFPEHDDDLGDVRDEMMMMTQRLWKRRRS